MENRASKSNGSATGPYIRRSHAVASLLFFSLLISGCAGGITPGHFNSVTDPAVTSSVPVPAAPAEREKLSDEMTIRNALSSANLEELGSDALSWANIDTGSRGAVTNISEFQEAGIKCRKFTASRESYEGIALYNGTACLLATGEWKMIEFTGV